MRWKCTKVGDCRLNSGFLLIPRKDVRSDEWRWMERTTRMERYTSNGWIIDYWIDDEIDNE